MAVNGDKPLLERIGCRISSFVADVAAHPFAQVGVILVCALWWILRLPTEILTAVLSIMAITLTQMVLNRQDERDADDHRRDVAMHAKLDELLISHRQARNELVGIENLEEDVIEELREEVGEAIDEAGEAAGDASERKAAKAAAEAAVETELSKARRSRSTKAAGRRR